MSIQKANDFGAIFGTGAVTIIGTVGTLLAMYPLLSYEEESTITKIINLTSPLIAGIGYGIVSHSLFYYEKRGERDLTNPLNNGKITKKTISIFIGEVIFGETCAALNPALVIGMLRKKDSDLVGMAFAAGALVCSGAFVGIAKAIQIFFRFKFAGASQHEQEMNLRNSDSSKPDEMKLLKFDSPIF